jgi:hypothetical protein
MITKSNKAAGRGDARSRRPTYPAAETAGPLTGNDHCRTVPGGVLQLDVTPPLLVAA